MSTKITHKILKLLKWNDPTSQEHFAASSDLSNMTASKQFGELQVIKLRHAW